MKQQNRPMTIQELQQREMDWRELMNAIDEGRRPQCYMPSDWGFHLPFRAYQEEGRITIKNAAFKAFVKQYGDPREYLAHLFEDDKVYQ